MYFYTVFYMVFYTVFLFDVLDGVKIDFWNV